MAVAVLGDFDLPHDLDSVALTLVTRGKGIHAADETVPTLTKCFDALGISPSTRPRSGAQRRAPCRRKGSARMTISPLAGKPAPKEMLVDLARLEREYFERKPDLDDPDQLVSFRHQRASRLAAARHRSPRPTSSPSPRPSATTAAARASTARSTWARTRMRFPGRPSAPRSKCWPPTACETIIQRDDGVTPTPVISRAILVYNRGRNEHLADGIVITPSHNPPEDGGFKYNPTNGGPADTDVTEWVAGPGQRAAAGRQHRGEARAASPRPSSADTTHQEDFVLPYVNDLRNVVDMEAIRAAGLKLGVDPLGGAAVHYWEPINAIYGLRHRRRQSAGRSDLLVHDRRSRRQDPHGLLEPVRDGQARRPQGSLSASPSPTIPIRIGTASSRRRPG